MQHQCTAALFKAKCNSHCSMLLCKIGPQQAVSHCSYTFGNFCFSYRCAVTQHKWSAALFRAKCNTHCSVLPCKTGSQQAVFHCSYTYANLLFIQVCSDATPMHCSSVQGRMQSPLFNAALQSRLTAGSVSLQLHLLNFLLFIQVCSDATPMHCSSVQGKMQSPLFNAALQNRPTAGIE